MNNAAPINLELIADSIFPSLIKVSSPEAIKKHTRNNPKNDPTPFKVLIRLDLFPTMFFIPKYNTVQKLGSKYGRGTAQIWGKTQKEAI